MCSSKHVLKRIHVNRHIIAFNKKHGCFLPCYTVKENGKTWYAKGVIIIDGTVTLVNPETTKPLSCGATIWIETNGEVIPNYGDRYTYDEVMQMKQEIEKND